MQLSALLDKLKGLFSTALLISTFTPLFCFIMVNALILKQFNSKVDTWFQDYLSLDTTPKIVGLAVFALALIVVAFVFSTLNLLLREILEGQRLLPRTLKKWLSASEADRLDRLLEQYRRLRRLHWRLSLRSHKWIDRLRRARGNGQNKNCTYPDDDPAHKSVEELEQIRRRGEIITFGQLKKSVLNLDEALTKNSADEDNQDSRRLDQDHERLIDLFDYAEQRAEHEYISLANEREFNFSRYTIAPTRMGNIAESVQSYAESRYSLNLVFFWTRLQKVIQAKTDFYSTLQDAKTQLDFTVLLFWLTVLSTAMWLVLLPILSHSWLPLICVWLVGPALARTWYVVALQNYRSFADLLRSSLDLFRFDLLLELKVSLPLDSETEQEVWRKLASRLSYGDKLFLSYKQNETKN